MGNNGVEGESRGGAESLRVLSEQILSEKEANRLVLAEWFVETDFGKQLQRKYNASIDDLNGLLQFPEAYQGEFDLSTLETEVIKLWVRNFLLCMLAEN